MKMTQGEALALFTIAIGTLNDMNPVGGVTQQSRAALVQNILNKQDVLPEHFSLAELNGSADPATDKVERGSTD